METASTNKQLLMKYLARNPDDLAEVLQHVEETGTVTDTAYVMNLIAAVRARNVYLKDERVSRQVAPLKFELVANSWEMPAWYSAQYNADVTLSVYRDRQKVTEGIYKCSRCNSKRTRQRTKKASGDEAIPVEIICVGCGNTWCE